MDKQELEETLSFTPQFDQNGLIPCITSCAQSGDVLMFAFMNAESLLKTVQTGEVHYWSRSRQSLWHKGATSGYTQKVLDMRTDCDQDCIWIKVAVNTPNDDDAQETACHTGRKSCFYRQIQIDPNNNLNTEMRFIDADRHFDPKDVYK